MRTPSQLGAVIRARRLELGFSLSQLAAATGIGKSSLSRLEAGVYRQPSAGALERLAHALQLPDTTLFGLLDEGARRKLPPLQPYLRAKYDLPDEVITEITAYLERYRGARDGPVDGEDEVPEQPSETA